MKLSAYVSPSRHGIYYFRWPLPVGEDHKRTSIRLSLRTRCPNYAGDLARHLASCGRLLKGNNELARLTRTELKVKVKAHFESQLSRYLDCLDRKEPTRKLIADATEEMLDHESFLEIESTHPQWLKVEHFKNDAGISDEDWADSQPIATNELRRGRRDLLRAVLEAVERLDGKSTGILTGTALAQPVQPSAPLGQAIEKFVTEHSRNWPEKTKRQVQAYLSILVEFFGQDRKLGTITRQDAGDVKEILLQLPSSRKTKPELKHLTLLEAIEVEGHGAIAPKTVNSHLSTFFRFFVWAERHGHSPHTLFEGMKVASAKPSETDRKPFSDEQTHRIYKELTENPSGFVKKDSHKWGALLALFTGARLNEICQLEIQDIQHDNGIWYLNITDEGDNKKSLKAAASHRKVPLHSELIRLGFLDFVKSRSKGNRLFSDYSYNSNGGYGRSLGRWFNESFLRKLEMKKQGVVFHCFRHTMITRLGQASVPEPIYQCIVGHARAGVTQQVYLRQGFKLAQLSEAIEEFEI